MMPWRPPHLIEASSSSANAACTRQRSLDVHLSIVDRVLPNSASIGSWTWQISGMRSNWE
uniref:Uncharacterized protein n=1 Tax=Oryza punctata TaxID=4537 RepID=A0A0E0LKE5_ORYPU